jgi:hypothetical protein
MRTISVSTDVFALLWSLRKPGEETEDAVLKRILKARASDASMPADISSPQRGGVYDARHRVSFPEGFELFRSYLGREYRARAIGGRWILQDDGRACGSLNELSRAIGARTENAWANWFYLDEFGQRRAVSNLRQPGTIASRSRQAREAKLSTVETLPTRLQHDDIASDGTWRDDVRCALELLSGKASLFRIYREVEAIRKAAGRSLPESLEAVVRRTLEDHSSDSQAYRGGPDLFYMVKGKGAGVWGLRPKSAG